ncbi:P-loop containing nucleoside triphosphate hydrolase protein [Phellopilus nigrolimitatus]|nr:P-loop containing nucleoside triphosphate hydrolase protein [Phellopilus nigrolimitatus]
MGKTKTASGSKSLEGPARPAHKVPAESEESDPDFVNNAPYEYERKGMSKGRKVDTGVRARGRPPRPPVKHLPGTETTTHSQNLLVELFGHLLQNTIETSDSDAEEDEKERDLDIDEDEYSDGGNSSKEKYSPSQKRIPQRPPQLGVSKTEDSETEPDTDTPIEFPSHIAPRKSPETASSNVKQCNDNEESVTESDTEVEDMFAPPSLTHGSHKPSTKRGPLRFNDKDKKIQLKNERSTTYESSVTESDDDLDETDNFTLNPRPSFPRDVAHPLVPLILDIGTNTKVPAHINTFLREYQRDGIKFLYERYKRGQGGILGDDMGLGKTVQVISFLSAIMTKFNDRRDVDRRRKHVSRLQDSRQWRQHKRLPPANATWHTCLIIAPSTVVHNWEREFETWGYFEVGMYTGPPEQRCRTLKDFKLGRLDVVLTSFDTARGDINLLFDLPWSVIFVDEAHKLKNPTSKITLAFNEFKCKVRFGLTGTAIQNKYDELWTLLDWSSPGRLGTLKMFKTCVSKPLAVGQSANASEQERAIAKAVAKIFVAKLLPSFFLRRTKDLIRHQLPKKIDEVVFCPLTSQQILVYKRILAHRERRIKVNGPGPFVDAVPCDCGSGLTRTNCCHAMDAAHFFTYLTVLLKISNHLALILPSPNDTEEQTKRNREVSKIAFKGETIPKYGPAILLPQFCGKWDVLNLLLKEWQKDRANKVLIFTKSVKLLDMLDYHLNRNSYSFCRLDGSTKQNERMPLIDKFNNDPEIFAFLISTLAGGTGLNLTGANKVVIFDPNWNPAHDLQAMDRAYRFGQTRDVHVYRLLGAGSIEELIYARQVYKQQMMKIGYEASHQTRYFEGVQGDVKRKGELFGAENLFKLHEEKLATQMAIEKAHLAELDWAFTNMASRPKGKGKSLTAENGDLRVGVKSRNHEESDLRGLETLLLDDDLPSTQRSNAVDEIHQILGAGYVKYSHQNDDLLRPSRVEEESLQTTLKKLKKRKAEEDVSQERGQGRPRRSPGYEWPPRRAHHQAPLSPGSKLRARHQALLETGIVDSEGDLPSFAARFASMSPEEQQHILETLDKHGRK